MSRLSTLILTFVLAAAVGTLLAVAAPLRAGTIAITPSGPPTEAMDVGGTGLTGFQFTVNQNISVTNVGFFADELGGADTPHVSILNVTAGATSVPNVIYDTGALTLGSLTDDAMNYVSVSGPLILVPSQIYQITAPIYWVPKYSASDTTSFSFGPAIASHSFLKGGGWSGWGNASYDFTALSGTPTAYYSVNFQYVVANVPEPASVVLFGFGAVGMCAAARRGRKA